MLLTKVTLDNFGVYEGKNEFDFRTNTKKPIILCGGKNGAGKTTLFDSVMLCLYGQDSFDQKISKKQFHDMILRSFHRVLGTKKVANQASITVEFEYAHGEISVYQVTRLWNNIEGKIEEEFLIKKKNLHDTEFTTLDSLEESEWQIFINQLIPKGIAKLFFFDGEKIQSIAEEGTEDDYIRSSFDTLLGLDLVNQLNLDLSYALERIQEDTNTKEIEAKINSAERERKIYEDALEKILVKQAQIKTDITNIQKKIQVKEENFAKLGGRFYERREQVLSSKLLHDAKIKEIERDIRELCGSTLPFSTIPHLLDELILELESDQKKVQASFAKDILEKNFQDILSQVNSDSFLSKMDSKSKLQFVNQLSDVFDDKIDSISNLHDMTFNFSSSDMTQMVKFIKEIKKTGIEEIQNLAQSYNTEIEKINGLKTELENVPQDNEIGPLRTEINQLNKELGHFEEQLAELKVQEALKRHYLNKESHAIRTNLSKKFADKKLNDGLELGPKILSVLEEYSDLLRAKKLELLENYFLDGLKMLLHKKDFIEKVTIDKETFEVKLFKGNDDEITKGMLSKGELQMFATAIVWGLAKTSGRPLPFMIDTPLARLDDEHRINLIENFLPHASHQILIFSTDSEFTHDLYSRLQPSIQKSFVIQFDSKAGKTVQHQGYFFDEIGEKIIEVQ